MKKYEKISIIFILFIANIIIGLNIGLGESLPGARGRQIQYISSAISSYKYGVQGYEYADVVYGALVKNGMGDPAVLSEKELILKFTNARELERAIFSSVNLDQAIVDNSPKVNMGLEDIGYIDYLKISYYLFGIKFISSYYLYYLILGIIIIVFYLKCKLSIERKYSLIITYLIGHILAIYVLPEIGFELLTITNPRFFGSLSILPTIHLISSIWSNDKGKIQVFDLLLQVSILIFLVKIRSSVGWTIILIYLSILLNILQNKQFNIKIISITIFIPLLFSIYSLSHIDDNKKIIKNHLIWHNQFISLTENPKLNKIFLEKYGVNGGDEVGFKAVEKIIKDQNIQEKEWHVEDGVRWPYSPPFYEEKVKEIYLSYILNNTYEVLKTYIYWKPKSLIENISVVIFQKLKVVLFKHNTILILLVIGMLAIKIDDYDFKRNNKIIITIMLFSSIPLLLAGTSMHVMGELILISFLLLLNIIFNISQKIKIKLNDKYPLKLLLNILCIILISIIILEYDINKNNYNFKLSEITYDKHDNQELWIKCQKLPVTQQKLEKHEFLNKNLMRHVTNEDIEIHASSSLNPSLGPNNLLTNDLGAFWHMNMSDHNSYENIELSQIKQNKKFNEIKFTPRNDMPEQFFKKACLFTVDESGNFIPSINIRIDNPKSGYWYVYDISRISSFKYRLIIPNAVEGQFHTFYSIGKIDFN